MDDSYKRRLMVISQWSYGDGCGGGEAFLYDSSKWLVEAGWEVIWVSFYDRRSGKPYQSFTYLYEGGLIHIIHIAPSKPNITKIICLFKPDLIHHQGNMRMEIIESANKECVPIITGFHYWNDMIDLYQGSANRILENYDKHHVSTNFVKVIEKTASIYCCSQFMSDVAEKVMSYPFEHVFEPISDNSDEHMHNSNKSAGQKVADVIVGDIYPDASTGEKSAGQQVADVIVSSIYPPKIYTTLINIHPLKGGEFATKLARNMPYRQFIFINNEPTPTDIPPLPPNITLLTTHQNIWKILQKTRVLLIPSLVDETFCRVCLEGMMSRTSIITTGRGNIEYLLGQDYPYIMDAREDNIDEWISAIDLLYKDDTHYEEIVERNYQKYLENHSLNIAKRHFVSYINDVYQDTNRIAIMVPWCDQGLGLQARRYVAIHPNMFIFSFTPYQRKSVQELQGSLEEWHHDRIYYSPNIREKIRDDEIVKFVRENRIRKFIIPETCWHRVFEIAELLVGLGITTYAIPNIEIVRRDEIYRHRVFDYILTNNMQTYRIFTESLRFKNVQYLGYAPAIITTRYRLDNSVLKTLCDPIYRNATPAQVPLQADICSFIVVGGLNAFSRKQCLEICEAFTALPATMRQRARLTITAVDNIDERVRGFVGGDTDTGIHLITGNQSFKDIMKLYQQSSVAIQVSKHEGLGLGFFDALSQGVPVLTLDTPPHNEIITENIGWHIPCTYVKMTDNTDGIVESAVFKMIDLTAVMQTIIEGYPQSVQKKKQHIPDYISGIQKDFEERFNKVFDLR